jgi:hypothetical protein
MGVVLVLLAAVWPPAQADERLQAILDRVAEEAAILYQMAPNLVSEETFVQRARKNPRRFRPRLGSRAVQPPKPGYATREIVSEYGYSVLKESPGRLHEFRQIVSIDGRRVLGADKARESLFRGLKSEDDRVKRRMLENFRKHGLVSAATDFGQLLLLFGRRRLADYEFRVMREERVGAEAAVVVSFRQIGGEESLVIFEGRTAVRQRLEGELWVRQTDSMPLRISLRSSRAREGATIRDEATVEYTMTPHGALAPVSVAHRQWSGSELVVENIFRYSAFRRFSAEAEIKFN